MISLLVRKEKFLSARDALLSMEIHFYEETKGFHSLFIFPEEVNLVDVEGKLCYLVDEDTTEVPLKGETFKIVGSRDLIEKFAPNFEQKGLKVKLDNPDTIYEIKRWGSKFLISVS